MTDSVLPKRSWSGSLDLFLDHAGHGAEVLFEFVGHLAQRCRNSARVVYYVFWQ